MRPTSVDTQKSTMNFPVTTDCDENQIHATQKLFRPYTQNIKDKPWYTLGPSCGPRAEVLLNH
jgi:hypothetical protein